MYDMGPFLMVLFITFIAFGDALLQISRGNKKGEGFIDNNSYVMSLLFVYRMVLGDWDTGALGKVALPAVWILFVLCTLFNMVVMLNLLIAIIGETFNRVSTNSVQAAFQQMASMIAENGYLIPALEREEHC